MMPFYKRTKDKKIEMSFMFITIFLKKQDQTGLNRSKSWSVIPIQGVPPAMAAVAVRIMDWGVKGQA